MPYVQNPRAIGQPSPSRAASFVSASSQSLVGPTDTALNGAGGYSVACRAIQRGAKVTAGIIDKSRTAAWGIFFELSGNKISYMHAGAEILKSSYGTERWYHLVATWDTATMRLYVDGTLAASTARTTAPSGSESLRIGRLHDGFHLGGSVDSAGFWSRAITPSEVSILCNNGVGRSYAQLPPLLLNGLVSWWDLAEASGTRRDSHGPNHLTPANSPDAGPSVTVPASRPSATKIVASMPSARSRPAILLLP